MLFPMFKIFQQTNSWYLKIFLLTDNHFQYSYFFLPLSVLPSFFPSLSLSFFFLFFLVTKFETQNIFTSLEKLIKHEGSFHKIAYRLSLFFQYLLMRRTFRISITIGIKKKSLEEGSAKCIRWRNTKWGN